jgi:hypothetical protein
VEVKFVGLHMGELAFKPSGADPSFKGHGVLASASWRF